MSRLKIIEVIPALHCGGAERFAVDLSNELSRRHDVTLLCVNQLHPEDFLHRQLHPAVKLVCLNKKENFLSALASMFPVWRFIARERPDVVHTHLGGLPMTTVAMGLNFHRSQFFHTVHNDAFVEAETAGRLRFRRELFRRGFTAPVTISEESARSFVTAYGFEAPMILNGCRAVQPEPEALQSAQAELSKWRSNPASTIFLNLARIAPQKNQLALALAVQQLVGEGENLDLVLMGADYAPEIRAAIVALHCDRIHLAGVRENPGAYLAQVDALCLPSLAEGLPISLLEAFSTGTPSCVSPVGGMLDLVHDGENGLLSAGTGVAEIMEMLRRFLRLDGEKRQLMRMQALTSFTPFSMAACAANYERLMEATL